MKQWHIIAIIIIALGIGVLLSSTKDMTSWANFNSAAAKQDKVKLIGELVKDQPIVYNPEKDPNYLSFYLKDEQGVVKQVVLHAGKPQDFERTEQIVLTGELKGDVFVASDMLLKCPSKYKDEEVFVRSEK